MHECFVVHISARKRDTSFLLLLLFSFFLRKMRSLYFPIAQSCAWTYTKRLHIQNTRGSRAIISFISATRFFASPLPPLLSPLPFLLLSRLYRLLSAYLQRRCPMRSDPLLLAIAHFQEASSSRRSATFSSCLSARHGSIAFAVLGEYAERNRGIRRDHLQVTTCRLSSKAMRAPPKTQSSSKSSS